MVAAPTATFASTWQVAGLVNVGEPTLRIVYDTSYPGASGRAHAIVAYLQAKFSDLSQPGVIDGLMEVGYSEHIDGVQVQLYGDAPYVDAAYYQVLEDSGIPMTPCWMTPEVCPTWGGR
jgi:hypothetical protein